MNIFNKTFDKLNNTNFENSDLILDINGFLRKRKYDPKANTDQIRTLTFMQSITAATFPMLFGNKFLKKVDELTRRWGKPDFHVRDMRKFYNEFGVGLKIFGHRKIKLNGRPWNVLDKKYESYWKKKVCLEIEGFEANKCVALSCKVKLIGDEAQLKYYECSKKHCFFATHRRELFERHVQYCRDESEIVIKQRVYKKSDESIEKELFDEGILPSVDFRNKFFGTFDIESLMEPDLGNLSSPGLMGHRLTSIAIMTNFSTPSNYFLCRKDMSAGSLKILMKEFVSLVRKLRLKMLELLPKSISDGLSKYEQIIGSQGFKFIRPEYKIRARRKLEFLKKLLKIPLYSWNGEKVGFYNFFRFLELFLLVKLAKP